mmetsp:Transcript_35123/g.74160  ORF Transcript_35123/g.74160 Transcript_35123/m.74160 type:complete len:466 (-) Transcript_35123:137-1534(-)|eukprot:CAMPEP_0183729876 /NCGR_PEP_ID=MMETSP0737-20130205/31417_1 /TAXON_ID=385413 /ORGANISM="Thalassiosira miniscula, Strain CCMP1093" /LENGTH=465 /DNA_ID=CAMNT_0025962187 /DNA_START=296 /DNA_END=1693 /DNA_ORIENTATION=-
MPSSKKSVAIIGGGITGATAAWKLSHYDNLTIHVFDQGRRGVGGRTSSRTSSVINNDAPDNDEGLSVRFDHGCQFFRADTPQCRDILSRWKDCVREWKGEFTRSKSLSEEKEFFGLPSKPPFYVGVDGMQSIAQSVLENVQKHISESSSSSSLRVFTGTRVANLEQCDLSSTRPRWKLHGTSGTAAFHDTPEQIARQNNRNAFLGEENGYDAIILTDVSSSFGQWHRASAGVPEEFAKRVRQRVGARVPLFSAMIAFDTNSNIPFDASSFDHPIVWFAAKSNSKPGMEELQKECWTIVSTPEYAMDKIEETPMQDPKTGEFIPQSNDYLTTVPGPDLYKAFESIVCQKDGILGENALDKLPEVVYMDAQRWGSALPCHRHLKSDSGTRRVISGVPYDAGRFALAPTKNDRQQNNDEGRSLSFLMDESLMLFQAGDMMSCYTPGLEGAVLSGSDAAECLYEMLTAL